MIEKRLLNNLIDFLLRADRVERTFAEARWFLIFRLQVDAHSAQMLVVDIEKSLLCDFHDLLITIFCFLLSHGMKLDVQSREIQRLFQFYKLKYLVAEDHLVEYRSLYRQHLHQFLALLIIVIQLASSRHHWNQSERADKRIVCKEMLGEVRRDLDHVCGAPGTGQVLILSVR